MSPRPLRTLLVVREVEEVGVYESYLGLVVRAVTVEVK